MNHSIILKVIGFEAHRFMRSPVMIVSAVFSLLIFGWMIYLLFDNAQAIYVAANNNSEASLFIWSFISSAVDNTVILLLRETPLMGGFYIVMLSLTPFFSMMLTCNQLASDSSSRHLRYILPRTGRAELLVARSISAIIFWFVLVLFYTLLSLIAFSLANVETALDANLGVALRMLIGVTFYGLPFILLMTFFNTFISNSFLIFLCGIGCLIILSIIASVMPLVASGLSFFEYLTPTAFKFELLSNKSATFASSLFFLVIFSVVFASLAMVIFRKRDL